MTFLIIKKSPPTRSSSALTSPIHPLAKPKNSSTTYGLIPREEERVCATPDVGTPEEERIASELKPEVISILRALRGVAEEISSAELFNTQGVENLDIKEEKEKNTKTLPAIAGLAQLHPSPPKVHFTIKIAKTDARTGIKRGIAGGIFIPIKSPVTRAE